MAGFDINRFIDLSQREENHLKCGICLNIFNTAISSQCGHTFCKQCVENWINNNHSLCPECRQVFCTRKRVNGSLETDNLLIIKNFVFNRNLKINSMISELKIRCDFEFNGCQEVLEFGVISSHINKCEHRFCKICNNLIRSDHNCYDTMRSEKNEWKLKYQKSEQTVKELTQKYENEKNEWKQKFESNQIIIQRLMDTNFNLEKEFKDISDILMTKTKGMMPLTHMISYVLFGSYQSEAYSLNVYYDGLKITFVSVNNNEIKLKRNILVPFLEIKQVMHCMEYTFPVLILKISYKHSLKIQKFLYLGDNSPNAYKFDVTSNDPKHWYIIVVLKEATEDLDFRLIEFYCKAYEPSIKCHSIDCNETQRLILCAQNNSSKDTINSLSDLNIPNMKITSP